MALQGVTKCYKTFCRKFIREIYTNPQKMTFLGGLQGASGGFKGLQRLHQMYTRKDSEQPFFPAFG